MNASTKTNNVMTNLKAGLRSALKSKAAALVMLFLFFIALCFMFNIIAKACLAMFGEYLGLVVYFIISFGAIFAIEAIAKRANTKLARRSAYR